MSCLNCLPEKYSGVQSYSGSLEVLEVYGKGSWLQLMHCTSSTTPLSHVLVFAGEYQLVETNQKGSEGGMTEAVQGLGLKHEV